MADGNIWDIVVDTSDNQVIVVTREHLEGVCPHRSTALVASYGEISEGVCSLVLDPEHFGPYFEGHPWFFPAHWAREMAALAAGFQAKHAVFLECGGEVSDSYNRPIMINDGAWKKKPPGATADGGRIICKVIRMEKVGRGRMMFSADVEIIQDDKSSQLIGIEVLLQKVSN